MKISIKDGNPLLWIISILFSSIIISCNIPIVPDPIDPRLPAYLTGGDNVAGALINDSSWVAQRECFLFGGCYGGVEINANTFDSTFYIQMSGKFTESPDFNKLVITFVFNKILINGWQDLRIFKDKKYALEGNNYAMINRNFGNDCQSAYGQVYFSEVRETDQDSFSVAGTFGIVTENDDCESFEVFKGRFNKILLKKDW